MSKKRKLFFKLYPSYLLITVGSLLAVCWFFAQSSKNFFIDQEQRDLEIRAQLIYDDILFGLKNSTLSILEERLKKISELSGTRVTVIAPTGEVLIETDKERSKMGNHKNRPEIREAMNGKTGSSIRYSSTLKTNMLYVAIPIITGNHVVAILRTSMSISSIDRNLNDIYIKTAWGTFLIIIFTGFICIFITRGITAPLEDLKDGAADVARGKLNARLPIPNIEEFGDLAASVNNMAEQLTERLAEITEQNNERNAILSSMLEGVLAIDEDNKIININRAARRLFNISKKEVKGQILQEVIRNTSLNEFVENIFTAGDTIEKEFKFYNGGSKVLKGKGTILCDINDKPIGALIVFNDITKIRKLETFKKDFIANVSHEIRTPLTVIMGSVEALLDGALESREDAEHFMKTIAKHSNRLNELVTDILDLSKIEQIEKDNNVDMCDYPLKTLINTVLELCCESAEKKNIHIKVNPFDSSLVAKMNHQLLEQAVMNLVMNAIKYSEPAKTIEITITENRRQLTISVADKGYGIPHCHLNRLFERFYRVDKARTRQEGGTGLGLAIVKHIAHVHNGEVKAESVFGEGSTFSITIPI